MGAFQSQLFDGDVAIDMYRSMPDREIVFWVRQAINLTQGWAFIKHAARVYPTLFEYQCTTCHGSGSMICPQCNGKKMIPVNSTRFQLSQKTDVGKLLAKTDVELCARCGEFCNWDHETDWEENWIDWQRKLAFYDRSMGPLLDEWYEYYLAGDQLERMEAEEADDKADNDEWHPLAQIDHDIKASDKKLAALMDKYGGHPYDTNNIIPYGIVDPAKSAKENIKALVKNNMVLPPELDVSLWPEFLAMENSPLHVFDEEIRREYLIHGNLEAALRDAPKPTRFENTAGTVPCPDCEGVAWTRAWFPNLERMMLRNTPLWLASLNEISRRQVSKMAAASVAASSPGVVLRQAEHPQRPPLAAELEFNIAESELRTRRALGTRSLPAEAYPDATSFTELKDLRRKLKPNWEDNGVKDAAGFTPEAFPINPYEFMDAFSPDPATALTAEEYAGLALNTTPVNRDVPKQAMQYRDMNPARRLTRMALDARVIQESGYDMEAVRWAAARNLPLDAREPFQAVVLNSEGADIDTDTLADELEAADAAVAAERSGGGANGRNSKRK